MAACGWRESRNCRFTGLPGNFLYFPLNSDWRESGHMRKVCPKAFRGGTLHNTAFWGVPWGKAIYFSISIRAMSILHLNSTNYKLVQPPNVVWQQGGVWLRSFHNVSDVWRHRTTFSQADDVDVVCFLWPPGNSTTATAQREQLMAERAEENTIWSRAHWGA